MNRTHLLRTGALLGALGVAAGAFGAHGLRAMLEPRDLEIYETAVRYQLVHALALVACAALPERTRRVSVAGWCFLLGVIVFSGSLYVLVLTGTRWLGAITPFGGAGLIAGWVVLSTAAIGRAPSRDQ